MVKRPKFECLTSLLLFTFLVIRNVDGVSDSATTMKQILDELFQQYDKGFRPYYGEKPTQVGVKAHVLSIDSVDELNMEFTFTFNFRQTWDDPRLAFRSHSQQRGRTQVKAAIGLDAERSKKIWRPNTFFVNEKTSRVHEATTKNEFVRIQSNGTVLILTRYTIKASCAMDLRYFPFDNQACGIEIENFGTTMDDTIYYWANGNESMGMSPHISLPGIRVTGHRIETMEISRKSGNYSRLTIGLEFARASGYYLLRCYLPMATFVTISLLTLVFANPFLEPLVHVLTVSLLILHSQETWIQKLPMISYFNSIYIYFFICLAHLLLSLFVSLGAAYRYLRQTQNDDSVCIICKPLTELDDYHHRGTNDRRRSPTKPKSSCNAGSIIFYFFKLLIIGSFIATNVVYWLFHRTLTYTANQKLLGAES